ncbi:phytanoyl-CoA dioxygenase family protein [Kribbella shirazensis]|uniref:Ectoine hydroxylase-related dioxygenase (Phytanoyl-CoA dioxygenase family) n=1 Tax=Kribbella shirazensis TaxID=1105143 RepID=A0A7X5V5R7_9ACTN|nr:phytanoyl-CoA dioxygenase family protein [Kribbella shirazensis]NIK55077.1 ectoine hydroxylase-related dioxygenase (phytanoyl-CoA dioxygenase family) [Kribbella shirazensis]
MLTADELDVFERDGIVKIPAAFSPDDAARMRDVLWNELSARHGMDRADRSTWDPLRPTGLKTTKSSRAALAILGPQVRSALDQLLGEWTEPKHAGQVLVTMPEGVPWSVPHRQWHTDVGFESPTEAVKIWALFGDLEPGGGGTPQVAGSHRIIERYLSTTDEREFKAVRDQVLRSDPWFRNLTSEERAVDPMAPAELDGLPVRVVELTGQAGDVYLTHPWILHSIAPNAAGAPRMMRSRFIWKAR